jgi:hypothetical protein
MSEHAMNKELFSQPYTGEPSGFISENGPYERHFRGSFELRETLKRLLSIHGSARCLSRNLSKASQFILVTTAQI